MRCQWLHSQRACRRASCTCYAGVGLATARRRSRVRVQHRALWHTRARRAAASAARFPKSLHAKPHARAACAAAMTASPTPGVTTRTPTSTVRARVLVGGTRYRTPGPIRTRSPSSSDFASRRRPPLAQHLLGPGQHAALAARTRWRKGARERSALAARHTASSGTRLQCCRGLSSPAPPATLPTPTRHSRLTPHPPFHTGREPATPRQRVHGTVCGGQPPLATQIRGCAGARSEEPRRPRARSRRRPRPRAQRAAPSTSIEEAQALAAGPLPSRVLVVNDARGAREHNVPELARG